MVDLLAKLNRAQKIAVTHNKGPLLVVAGAGTGKTTVLINRLAYLILETKVASDDILLLTFTEKAAGEMEERADKILPYGCTDLWINTFHGFGERILREHALEIGLSPSFKLLATTDQWVLVRKNLTRFNLDYFRPLGNPTKFISELLKHFSRLKDENINVLEYLDYVNKLKPDAKKPLSVEDELEFDRLKELAEAYKVYNDLLLENDFLDFGDLIIYTISLLKTRPNVLRYYQNKFKYTMVDEFQDTNLAQYELIKLLAAPNNNLLVTGDDDQAIYKFRGASISNIMQFKEDFTGAKEIVLIENYRSRQEILDCAYTFIKNNNPNRLEVKLNIDKKLNARNDNFLEQKKVSAVNYYNFKIVEDEISFVSTKIKEIYSQYEIEGKEIAWSDFAILVRANNTAEPYVKELNRQNIPNQFMSWRGLYYKPLILDVLAYFRLLDNYHESSALYRVLSMEIFKVSHIDMIAINKMARRKVWSLFEALKNLNQISNISASSQKNVKKLLDLVEKHSVLAQEGRPTKIFLRFAYDSGLLQTLDRDKDLEEYSYLNQFYQKIKKLEESSADLKLKDFLEAINLELEAGETGSLKLDFADNNTVKIMTVHGAKGLEFKYVFIVNLVDKKFPTISRSEKISIPEELLKEKIVPSKNAHQEEERRLFYVALTRAKDELFLSGARDYGGVREKKPSIFIPEAGLTAIIKDEGLDVANNEFIKDLESSITDKKQGKKENKENISYPLPGKFSFSQLSAFSTCPLQYKFAFVLKIPTAGDKAALIFGRSLHDTLYNFLLPFVSDENMQASLFLNNKNIKKENLITSGRLKDIYKQYWQSDGYSSKEERKDYFIKGEKALLQFLKAYQNEPTNQIVFLEKKFSFKVGEDVIKGVIDRVDRLKDGSLEVIDYKTGATKDKLDFKQKRQLILYQLFLEEYLQEKVAKLTYYYLESGEKVSFVATDKEKIKIREQILGEIKAIKEKDFGPTPSPLCHFCDFGSICEFKQK